MQATEQSKIEELKNYIEQVKDKKHTESYLIAVLHKTQQLFGFLSRDVMDLISEQMNIPTAHIWGVATFYHYFNLEKPGRHVISVCLGTACYVKGAGAVMDALKDELKIDVGEVTEDGMFGLEGARCLGACGLAPVVMIDEKIYGDLTPEKIVKIIRDIRKQELAGK